MFKYVCVCCLLSSVRRDVQEDDEEAVRVKEQSILELGNLLAKTGQAAGLFAFCPLKLRILIGYEKKLHTPTFFLQRFTPWWFGF